MDSSMLSRRSLLKSLTVGAAVAATPGSLLAQSDAEFVNMGFGISNYYEHLGNRQRSDEIMYETLERGENAGIIFVFDYIAARVEKEKRRED